MTDPVMGLIIGFLVGTGLLSVLLWVAVNRVRASQADQLESNEATIADLRQEMAEDKETNRRLRHQLHALSSGTSTNGSTTDPIEPLADVDPRSELDSARAEIADLRQTLESTQARLVDREEKLSEYREAVKEIRLSLEAQDRLRGLISITGDVPEDVAAQAQAD